MYQLCAATLIAPSPTNPRHRQQNEASNLKAWKLQEMADSIRQHGVMQPITVRPNPLHTPGDGLPTFELVAGERRWRGSQLAGVFDVPCIVRELTDLQVLELQITENIQDEPLHALEEAEHFERMLAAPGGPRDLDELAVRLGKSASLVRNRLELLKLCTEVREATLAGHISASVALEIANGVPLPADQAKALKEAVAGWGGEPFSARSMRAHIKKTYNLRLDQARFDTRALYIGGVDNGVQRMPACTDCPKRSGANPDFFADVKEGDLCQDAACFGVKSAAARRRLLDAAREEGATVVSGPTAKDMLRTGKPDGYQLLDAPCRAFSDHPKSLRIAVNDQIALSDYVYVDDPGLPAPVTMVTDAVAHRALKAAGLLKITAPVQASVAPPKAPQKPQAPLPTATPATATKPSPPRVVQSMVDPLHDDITDPLFEAALQFKVLPEVRQAASLTQSRIDAATREGVARARALLIAQAISRTMRTDGSEGMPMGKVPGMLLCMFIWDEAYADMQLAAQMADVLEPQRTGIGDLAEWALSLTEEEATRVLMLKLAMQDADTQDAFYDFAPLTAQALGIDPAPMQDAATHMVHERVKLELLARAPQAPAKAAKAAKAKAKPAARYRDPMTGETWSGRGLMPKWLKVAIEQRGSTLADFDVTVQATAKSAAAAPATEPRPLSNEPAWPLPGTAAAKA